MITVEWANEERTIIRWYMETGWTWEDFRTAQLKAREMVDSVLGIVDELVLANDPRYTPPNALVNLREISQLRHPRHGLTYAVGASAFINMLLNTLGRIIPAGNHIRPAATEEEALAMIEETRKQRGASDMPVA